MNAKNEPNSRCRNSLAHLCKRITERASLKGNYLILIIPRRLMMFFFWLFKELQNAYKMSKNLRYILLLY